MRVKRNKKLLKKRTLKRKNPKILKKIALALVIVLVATVTYAHFLQPHTLEVKQKIKLETTQQQLTKTRSVLLKTQSQTLQDEKAKQDQINQLNEQLKSTQAQLQAKVANKAAQVYAAAAPVYTLPADTAKAYIYDHESGNDPARTNSIGCFGIGQDCNGIVRTKCGTDYACQDQYFTDYMLRRYGSWAAAYAFWIRTDPRPYPGHWW